MTSLKTTLVCALTCISSLIFAQDEAIPTLDQLIESGNVIISATAKRLSLSRTDSLPSDRLDEDAGDSYMEGYVQALIDAHYYEYNVLVYVKGKTVYLYNLPNNELFANSIVAFVDDIPGVENVKYGKDFPEKELEIQEEYIGRSKIKGVWFPQSTLIYQPMIASPRNPNNSVSYRLGDDVMGNIAIAVSLGDVFPVFRWREVFAAKGDLQFDIEGTVWSVFNMWADNNANDEIAELMNSDYLVGFPFSYAFDNWSFRLRPYHISSHLGDEFLAKRPNYQRANPSMEAIDFFTSYQFNEIFRTFVGLGWIFHSDPTYHLEPFYVEWGAEVKMPGYRSYYHQLYGSPFVAVYFRNWQAVGWKLDTTLTLGYEWSKLQGIGRKIRLFLEYHNGYSDGEFFKDNARYCSIKATYGY